MLVERDQTHNLKAQYQVSSFHNGRPLVAFWSWKNTWRQHNAKLVVAKEVDVAVLVMMVVIKDLVHKNVAGADAGAREAFGLGAFLLPAFIRASAWGPSRSRGLVSSGKRSMM